MSFASQCHIYSEVLRLGNFRNSVPNPLKKPALKAVCLVHRLAQPLFAQHESVCGRFFQVLEVIKQYLIKKNVSVHRCWHDPGEAKTNLSFVS